MAWAKMDDQFIFHEKARLAGKEGRNLYLSALCYCANQLNDGFIRDGVLPTILGLAETDDPDTVIAALVEVVLWERVPGGYQIHDYLKYNPSRAEVLATREARAEAGRIGGIHSGESKRESKSESKTEAKPNPVPGPGPVSSSSSGSADDDDPLVDRMIAHGVTPLAANRLVAGREPLATAWLDYVDAHPKIPNPAATLSGNIPLGKPPPINGHGPPGIAPPRPVGLSEADLEVQRELQRATPTKTEYARAGPSPPTR